MSSITPGISSATGLAPGPEVITAAAAAAAAGDAKAVSAAAAGDGIFSAYMQLTKARLSALVLLTAMVGYILGSDAHIEWVRLMWTMLGTGLAAGSASSFNQIIEISRDRRMLRTRHRPLPAGRMSKAHGLAAGIIMGTAGVAILALLVNVLAAALALLTILIYVLAYTPLKVRSTLNTIVGAVSGAIPPMIGWVAAAGEIQRGAWLLAIILFIWQIPHFLALAWLYREDYQRGGFMMLPVLDRAGALTTRVVVLTAALLLPASLVGTMWNVTGPVCAAGSLILGFWLMMLCLRFHVARDHANARTVFLASIAYLPLLMLLMVLDRV